MKYSIKPILIFLVMFILAVPIFAVDIKSLKQTSKAFSEEMVNALPFNSSIGLNWSDAYIGGFPHFGIGLSAGFTTMDIKPIWDMMNELNLLPSSGKELPSFFDNKFPLPAYSLETRIGFPAIPLDFGVKVGYLPPELLETMLNAGIRNLLIGADVRYAIINSKVIPMRLSVGLGFNYVDGGISSGSDKTFNFAGGTGNDFNASEVDVIWGTTNIEFKVQASFPFKIITPYAGAGISYAWSKAGYKISGLSSQISDDYSEELDLGVTKSSKDSFETIIEKNGSINTRIFGGFSINLAYVRLDLTGMYELLNKNFGATLGIRFQM